MNDRFKFRGITKGKVNEFIYGSLLWYAGEPQIWDKDGKNYIVQSKTVGQCTGLKDKNGTLIYEGDIVKFQILEDFEAFGANEKYINITGNVIYEYGGFFVEQYENNLFLGQIPQSEIEVIGNIYQDSHLLEN